MTKALSVGVAGCNGRMGRMIVECLSRSKQASLACGSLKSEESNDKNKAQLFALAGKEFALTSEAEKLVESAEAIINFTTPELTLELAELCAKHGKILVIGTTGLDEAQTKKLEGFAKQCPIVWSANMSLGVNVLNALVEKAASLLDESYDIEIDEMHHARKVDVPSGTALMLGQAAADGRNVKFEQARHYYTEGISGARKPGTIGLSARRGGDVVGVHTVTLAGPGENLELTHRGFSREIYASGAIKAALWAKDQKPGLYDMKDVLGL